MTIIESDTRLPGARPVIALGTIQILNRWTSYNRDNWHLGAGALAYTDEALLAYCGYTPEFGGIVERFRDGVTVSVYTD